VPIGLAPEVLDPVDVPPVGGRQLGVVVDPLTLIPSTESVLYPTHKSEDTTLSGLTFRRMIGTKVSRRQAAIIWAYTFPPRLRMPNTGALPPALRPRFPSCRPPK
jgi:hypothetical protein